MLKTRFGKSNENVRGISTMLLLADFGTKIFDHLNV